MSGIHETPAWKKLEDHAAKVISKCHLRDLLNDAERCAHLTASHDGINVDYSRQSVVPETMDLLFELAETARLKAKMDSMAAGDHINSTENRSVLHFALRAAEGSSICSDGANVVPEVHKVLRQVAAFSSKVRNGEWLGCTGKAITNIVSVGIGGSYLGPEFVFESLRNDPTASTAASGRTLRFLANVDPVDVSRALSGLDPETTLVCIVSKTFTTAETMMNARTVVHWLLEKMLGITKLGFSGKAAPITREVIIRQHMVAISTAVQKATDFGIDPANIFPFWDWVGGRYSVCSAVGMLPLSLHYGYDVMAEFLRGAREMDKHFFEAPLRSNLPVLMGLLGVWNASFMRYNTRAVLPYAQALLRFPAHIQQLEMESNGKRVSASTGAALPYPTGEVIFGEPGTNGQHSFYQLIHQGSNIVPCEFIGFLNSQTPVHYADTEAVPNHDELMSNFFAQPDALACGKTVTQLMAEGVPAALHPHKEFPGNRPSLSLLFKDLTAYSTGQLLSLYEHRTAVQGFIWDLNSFDQWGVELGKVLAVKVRNTLVEANHQVQGAGAGGSSAAASATAAVNLSGYNPSTRAMLSLYIQNKAAQQEQAHA